jgi:hypothetical protein
MSMTMLAEDNRETLDHLDVALDSAIERLSRLTMTVDRLSGSPPLTRNPGLRAQLRRSAMDALSHTARACELCSAADRRRLLLRSLRALGELGYFARLAGASSALGALDVCRIEGLAAEAADLLQEALSPSPASEPGAHQPFAGLPTPLF